MKITFFLIVCSTLLFISSCGRAQNNTSDEQIMKVLKEFYIANSSIWSIPPSTISPVAFNKKIDSLVGKYCTSQLRAEAKKYLEDGGYDLMTNEKGSIIEPPKTLSIAKDSSRPNTYIVFYSSFDADASGKHIQKKVTLSVIVVNERGKYKISSVK